MNIGVIADTFLPLVGGAEIVMLELARRYRSAGHRVEFFTATPGPDVIEGFQITRTRHGKYLHRSLLLPRNPWALIWELHRFAARQEVFHLHFGLLLSSMSLRFIPRVRRGALATLHNMPAKPYGLIGRGWQRRTVQSLAPRITGVSAEVAAAANQDLGFDKCEFIPNGVDTDRFLPPSQPRGEETNFVIVSPVRLRAHKRVDILLEALPEILQRLPQVRLQILGKGTEEKNLRHQAKSLGVEERVDFLGLILPDRMPQFLAKASLAAFPSEREGLPLAALESMSCGLPLVTSNLPIFRTLVGNNERGIVVEQQNDHPLHLGFALAIIDLLLAGERRQAIGDSARAYVRDNYDWDNIAQIYLTKMKELLSFNQDQ